MSKHKTVNNSLSLCLSVCLSVSVCTGLLRGHRGSCEDEDQKTAHHDFLFAADCLICLFKAFRGTT